MRMIKLKFLIKKWHSVTIEKKIILSWIVSLVIITVLSIIVFISKVELRKSSDRIVLNSNIRISAQNVLSTIQNLELTSKRFILSGSEADSEEFVGTLSHLDSNVIHLETLLNTQPALQEYLIPLKTSIEQEFYKMKYLTLSLKDEVLLDKDTLIAETNLFKKLTTEWNGFNDKFEESTIGQAEILHLMLNRNLNKFLILVVIYLLLLSVLFMVIIKDVKKRVQLAKEVNKNRSELNTIINTVPALIFVKDIDKKFQLVNNRFLEFFKTKKEKIISKSNSDIISLEDSWLAEEEDDAVLNNKISLTDIQRNVVLSDGKNRWLKINKSPLIDKENNILGIVGVMDDITEQVKFQEELVKTKNELEKLNLQKDKLFSVIAHDLRSPFTGLLGFSEILKEDYNQLSEQEKIFYIDGIDTSLKNTLIFVDNLLTWTRMNMNRIEFNPKEIRISEVINSVLLPQRINADSKGIELSAKFDEQLKIIADAGMIETVIRNLISNAVKFTGKGGRVEVSAFEKNDSVEIKVEDTGIGMSDPQKENLFKEGETVSTRGTNNEKGTGLGLIICREFVDKHKGEIVVKSEIGKGTSIAVILPKVY